LKIVFLCTSLAAGRDGVGDYTRQLAASCTAAGHVCLLVGINDRHLTATKPLLHESNEVRFSAGLTWQRRARLLADLLREFDPHWISWQMVPYGYHAKGILPKACLALADAARAWPNHVMLHEVWIGLAQSDRLRSRVVGALQKRKLLAFLERLRPACLHTTNAVYQIALARCGWPAEILPLFGNIPVVPVKRPAGESALLELAAASLPPAPRYIGVLFGTIHPQWKPQPTIEFLKSAAAASGRTMCLLALGRAGAYGTKLLPQLAKDSGMAVIGLGPQSPEHISQILQAADFGIATHPWALLEKSGTTVSLLEHGLPVLVPRDDWKSRQGISEGSRDALLRKMDGFPPSDFVSWISRRRAPIARLPSLAAEFIAHLSAPASRGALVA
jgi:hypothetical protein